MGTAKDKVTEESSPEDVEESDIDSPVKAMGIDTETLSKSQIRKGSPLAAQASKGSSDIFEKATIISVLYDPLAAVQAFNEDTKKKILVKNFLSMRKSPKGSLLVKPDNETPNGQYEVVYPFFQSHVMYPAHPGEQVWTFLQGGQKYWFSRVATSSYAEDLNWTHAQKDMTTPALVNADAKEKSDSATGSAKNVISKVLSGLGANIGRSSTTNEADQPLSIIKSPIWNPVNLEPVPRFTPRSGDLVLQGSHNTLISFSTDRGWTKIDETFDISNANDEFVPSTGTIDIVVGRGQWPDDSENKPTTEDTKGSDANRTAPQLIQSDTGTYEVDKITHMNDIKPNPCEGDPDFHLDLSRIYVSMNSEIDKKLQIADQYNEPIAGSFDDTHAPSIALKSNEVRIIAREDGSVRILKEKGEGNSASIVLAADGTVHISGDKVYVGQPGGNGEGDNGSEPYVLHSYLKEWCETLHDHINTFCTTMITHVTPGYGVPSPQITQASTQLQADMLALRQKIMSFPSSRIYGE